MKYPRILAAIRSAKWAVTPAILQAITDTLGAHLRGSLKALPADNYPALPAQNPPDAAPAEIDPSTAVIQVYGILGQHLSIMDMDCGGCDVSVIAEALDEAMDDPKVSEIVLDFDSPGGVVSGIPELAEKIRANSAQKPIYAFVGSQCCSAAYWLASQCTAIFCTKSADLGSIGVYVALCDDSEWWKKEGYKLELIKAGEFKAAGISGQPLSDKERALIQADVDAIYQMFTADVTAGRSGVENSTMQGQTFMGAAAISAHLADEMVIDLETLLASLPAASTQK